MGIGSLIVGNLGPFRDHMVFVVNLQGANMHPVEVGMVVFFRP